MLLSFGKSNGFITAFVFRVAGTEIVFFPGYGVLSIGKRTLYLNVNSSQVVDYLGKSSKVEDDNKIHRLVNNLRNGGFGQDQTAGIARFFPSIVESGVDFGLERGNPKVARNG